MFHIKRDVFQSLPPVAPEVLEANAGLIQKMEDAVETQGYNTRHGYKKIYPPSLKSMARFLEDTGLFRVDLRPSRHFVGGGRHLKCNSCLPRYRKSGTEMTVRLRTDPDAVIWSCDTAEVGITLWDVAKTIVKTVVRDEFSGRIL